MTVADSGVSAIERVASALRQEIISGVLHPGTRLKDHELADRYGVSRNTLRDAVRRLEVARLVEFRRNAGGTVRTVDAADIRETFSVRRALELSGVRASADASPIGIARMNNALAAAGQASQNLVEARTAGLGFHKALVEFNGSRQLNDLFDNVLAQLRLAFNWMPVNGEESLAWHDRDVEIALQISDGYQERACALLLDYLADSESRLIQALDG